MENSIKISHRNYCFRAKKEKYNGKKFHFKEESKSNTLEHSSSCKKNQKRNDENEGFRNYQTLQKQLNSIDFAERIKENERVEDIDKEIEREPFERARTKKLSLFWLKNSF